MSKCPDCGVNVGEQHHLNCDVERCSSCDGQRFSCDCKDHDPSKTVWEGEWPGKKECRKLGFYCQDGFGPDLRYGSFCPCDKDDPDAMEDLNRYLNFKLTGKDDLYEGCTRKPRKNPNNLNSKQEVKKLSEKEEITLLDYYAAKAMQILDIESFSDIRFAVKCFDLAKIMLKVRKEYKE